MTPANKNSILTRWVETLAGHGSRPAVFNPEGGVLRTFGDIEGEACALTDRLRDCPPHSVVAMQIGNSPSWPALVLAAARVRCIPLPLGRHIERVERDAALKTCHASVLLEANESSLVFRPLRDSTPGWNDPAQPLLPAPDFLKLTSGTTSAPRAVRFRWGQLVADCDNICSTMGIRADDLNFGVIPFSHSYGFSNLITPLLLHGVPLVASEDRMPRAILHGLAATGATVFPGMPVFFEKFCEMENLPALPRLRLCISAGAPLPRAVGERFTRTFGRKIHTFYGSSECGGIGYDRSEAIVYETSYAGFAMNGVRITPVEEREAARQDAASTPAAAGAGAGAAAEESGNVSRIQVESDAVGDGYFPEPEPATLGGGRFMPADLVRLTGQGMYLLGRASDVINIAGRKLNPAEVEAQLLRFPGVKQAVVFGVPSELRNEEAIACVTGTVDPAQLLESARTVLSAWQTPRDVWLVEEIPTSERGKTSRRELARQYLARKGAPAPAPGGGQPSPPAAQPNS